MTESLARRLWVRLEHIHAVTYFAPECRAASKDLGLRRFWSGYFACRAAPLGPVGPGLVEAVFFNFAPGMVRQALPAAWQVASPDDLLSARAGAAAAALRRIAGDIDGNAGALAALLNRAIDAADPGGRPLFAANRSVLGQSDPVGRLWEAATTLREHRGDGHVAVLAAEGIDGCEAHLLLAADHRLPPELLRDNRGWTGEEWAGAAERLVQRRLLTADGELTAAGNELRTHVENRTDTLAERPFRALDEDAVDDVLRRSEALAAAVGASGVLPFPNPMGLPALTAA